MVNRALAMILAVMLLVSIGFNLLRTPVVSAQTQPPVPNGVQTLPLNPAGYCATQTAPNVNGNTNYYSYCADATGTNGTLYGAMSGKTFSPVAGTTAPSGKNCPSLAFNNPPVNPDKSWNMTCITGWQ